MDGDVIAKVEIVEHNETDSISDPAIEPVPTTIVEADSAEVDNISGATVTSNAIKETVADALSQMKNHMFPFRADSGGTGCGNPCSCP